MTEELAREARAIKAGIVGLGAGGGLILRSLGRMPQVSVVAVADPRPQAGRAFQEQHDGRAYQGIEDLCADPEVEVVWVATPTHLHCQHAVALAEHGKHVIVEKPMAVSLQECERMIEAAEKNSVVLIAGGTRSFDPAFVEMRRLIASDRLGRLGGLTTWSFTGWIIQPREPHELDVSLGGGGVYNQAPHPIDVLRLLGGGKVRSVRAMTGQWMPERPGPAYFAAYLEFEDGTPATLVYDGYGYLLGWELLPWGETTKRRIASDAAYKYRRKLRQREADDAQARELLRFGDPSWEARMSFRRGDDNWAPQDAGIVIASCESGVIRQSATGLYVYDDDGRHDEALPQQGDGRTNEVGELLEALSSGRPALHDGRWGMATMEVVLAIMLSAAERREILLDRQVPVRD